MNCADVAVRLQAYADGELPVGEAVAVDVHCAGCRPCADAVGAERELRLLVRRQPREAAPAELRARTLSHLRREVVRMHARRWLAPAAGLGVAATIMVVVLPGPRQTPPLVADLVDKHIAYAQIERPAELASGDRGEVAGWFMTRAGMRVTVPDYSPTGIRLIGARLTQARERRAAYLLYEKGRILLSVFIVPVPTAEGAWPGRRVAYRGQEYVTREQKGFRTVSWTGEHALFGLVSSLDYEVLLECADRLRQERADQTRV